MSVIHYRKNGNRSNVLKLTTEISEYISPKMLTKYVSEQNINKINIQIYETNMRSKSKLRFYSSNYLYLNHIKLYGCVLKKENNRLNIHRRIECHGRSQRDIQFMEDPWISLN